MWDTSCGQRPPSRSYPQMCRHTRLIVRASPYGGRHRATRKGESDAGVARLRRRDRARPVVRGLPRFATLVAWSSKMTDSRSLKTLVGVRTLS